MPLSMVGRPILYEDSFKAGIVREKRQPKTERVVLSLLAAGRRGEASQRQHRLGTPTERGPSW